MPTSIISGLILATPALGLAMIIAWVLGWSQTALWLYVFGVAMALVENASIYRRLSRDLSMGRKQMVTSVDLSLFADVYRFSDTKGRLKVLSLFIGEAGAWPFKAVLTVLATIALSFIVKIPKNGRIRVQYQLAFRFPPTLMLFAGYLFQTAFLLLFFDDSVRNSVSFTIASAVNISLFIVFSLHLFASDKFSKNFSRSAINPRLYVVLAITFAVSCAILIRLDFIATFLNPALVVDGQSMFNAFRAMTVNLKVLDLFAILKESNDFGAFRQDTYTTLASMTPLQVLDLYLGTALVANFLRLFKSISGFKYEDEDHSKVAMAFLDAGQFQKARSSFSKISKAKETKKQQGLVLVAIATNDTEDFVLRSKHTEKESEFAGLGTSRWATEYMALSKAVEAIPMDDATFFEQLDGYWKRHKNPAAVFALFGFFGTFQWNNFIKNGVGRNEYAEYAFVEVVDDVENLLKQMHDVNLENQSGSDFVATVEKKYGEGQLTFALLSALSVLEHTLDGSPLHEAKDQVRGFVDEVLEHVDLLMVDSGTIEPISFGVLPLLVEKMERCYKHLYGEKNRPLSDIITRISHKIRDEGLEAQKVPLKFSNDR